MPRQNNAMVNNKVRKLRSRRKLEQFDRRKRLMRLRAGLYLRRRQLVSKKRWLNLKRRDKHWFDNLCVLQRERLGGSNGNSGS